MCARRGRRPAARHPGGLASPPDAFASLTRSRQTQAEKDAADKNILISADNAKNAAAGVEAADQYAAQLEAKAKLASSEQPKLDDRVKEAEEALKAANSK